MTGDGQTPEAKLYSIPGSHPAVAARRMLELKGIPYKRVDLMPVISRARPEGSALSLQHRPVARDRGAQDHRLAGDRRRSSTGCVPILPSIPSDHDERVAVAEAERWGEEVLQPAVRRISWNVLKRDRAPLAATPRAPGWGCRSASR